jgi:hypothetical protein
MKISVDLTDATAAQAARFSAPALADTLAALRRAAGAPGATIEVWSGPYSTPATHVVGPAVEAEMPNAVSPELTPVARVTSALRLEWTVPAEACHGLQGAALYARR